MFSWLGDILGTLGESISSVIFDTMLRWFYDTIYGAAAAFLAQIGSLGTEIFDLDWVQAFVRLFGLLAWALYATGVVVAVFDVAIEYQTGRANLKTTALNVLKGFFACSPIGELPIALYKFCITLQGSFLNGIVPLFSGSARETLAETGTGVLVGSFFAGNISSQIGLVHLLCLTAFLYCFVKLFFANIKRRHFIDADRSRQSVSFQRAARLHGWFQPVDAAGRGAVSDGVFADDAAVCRPADLPGEHVPRPWHYAGGKRGAAHRAAVRA